MSDLMDRLRAPFPPDRVSWRIGSTTADKKKGMALAYIDARDVMDRLDEVCGVENWQCDYPHANGKTVCRIGIRIEGTDWVWKADGAGDTDVEAEKGALSDAFKRAAVRWGIGRYLYDLASPWVEIEARGRSFVIPDTEQRRLAKMLGAKPAPQAQQKPQQETPAQEYLRVAKEVVCKFGNAANLGAWWKDEAPHRLEAGIVKGTDEYDQLYAFVREMGEALTQRAAAE
jgi:hypothetical protein